VRCLCTPHKRTLFGEGKRGVQPRLFCILWQGVWGCGGSRCPQRRLGQAQVCARDRQFLSQNGDGYEVQGCGRGGGGSEVWLHARVLLGCEARCEILAGHGAVAMSTKTNKLGAAAWALARTNLKFCSRAPREGVPPRLS